MKIFPIVFLFPITKTIPKLAPRAGTRAGPSETPAQFQLRRKVLFFLSLSLFAMAQSGTFPNPNVYAMHRDRLWILGYPYYSISDKYLSDI